MGFLPAWAVDGSTVPASMARRATHTLSGGASGIAEPTDLRVLALAVPGSSVRVMPGSALVSEGYPQAGGQTWAVANDAADGDAIVSVPATGSGAGATRYVIVRVDDPEFGGQEPVEPLTAVYSRPELVSSLAGINYPHEPLARIDQPASTATITQAMITDLREVAIPRSLYVQRSYNIITGQEETLTGTTIEWYPNAGAQSGTGKTVFIPEWATRVSVIATWVAVQYRGGNTFGGAWVSFGPQTGTSTHQFNTQQVGFDSDGASYSQRVNWICTDTVNVDPSIRGTSQPFVFKGQLRGGTGTSRPYMSNISGVSLQLQFLEVATQDA